MLYEPADDARLERNIDIDFPSLQEIRNVYRALCNYYKIPLGSGADTRHDFDLQEVCDAYNLDVRRFFSACRFLEREGLIALPDREEAYSSLYIPLGRDQLYRFQVDHMAMGNLLQLLIRMYPGLFSGATPIDELKVAARCMMEREEVCQMLQQMHAMHVVDYRPRPAKPQILFPTARVSERDIYLADDSYRLLREAARRRLVAVLQYLHNDSVCRCRQMLAYFGEQDDTDCGRCDVCLRRRQKPDIETRVHDLLLGNSMDINTLTWMLETEGYSDVQEAVRRMLDAGTLYLDPNNSLSVR